jgi:ribosomal protein RSM22 (predicted rRNA methylase)
MKFSSSARDPPHAPSSAQCHHEKVHLPSEIAAGINEHAAAVPFGSLKRAAATLSEAFRAGGHARGADLPPALRVAAYLAVRMPATYAAAYGVLAEVARRLPLVSGILDVGAGAGAASLAARELFPLGRFTLLEPDPHLAAAGRKWLPSAAWQTADLRDPAPLPPHDLVVAAYSLGEVSRADAMAAAVRMWQASGAALVVIEPGTPAGFSLLRDIRARLLEAGAHMLAPCPRAGPCPMREPDWCHFGCRVERSSLHRRLKDATLPYEDEKFCYVALSKTPVAASPARIIRRPHHAPGLITLELCDGSRAAPCRVSRRDGSWRAARAAQWGGPWTPAG